MRKIPGILALSVAVFVATAVIQPNFISAYNLQNLVRWTSLFGVISLGAMFVIVTGGIDLSIGSVVCLVGCVLAWLLDRGWSTGAALAAAAGLSLLIGLAHGLLITRLSIQPFVVTLCGLLIYRGLARWLTADQTLGFGSAHDGLRRLATGRVLLPFQSGGFALPTPFFILLFLAAASAIVLYLTTSGRSLLALGRNEEAARFSGIRTHRLTVLAYIACAALSGLGGVLFALDCNSVQPASMGNFYELYAIAAAVLGGCSLRGGEVSVLGTVLGAAVMRILYNAINLLQIPTQLEFAIIGTVLLLGVMTDEGVRRLGRRLHARNPRMTVPRP